MTTWFMLDTNIVSHAIKGRLASPDRLVRVPVQQLCISSITAGEIYFGLANKPEAIRLNASMTEFLRRLEIMAWGTEAAACYGQLRARLHRAGRLLDKMDMLIAAHAVSLGATLVTNDAAFAQIPGLTTEDWTKPPQ